MMEKEKHSLFQQNQNRNTKIVRSFCCGFGHHTSWHHDTSFANAKNTEYDNKNG
jgi:hypothetical protein